MSNIEIHTSRIRSFHVKDAEFPPTARQGVCGGFQSWANRAGRFRSLSDGQVDFRAVFGKPTRDRLGDRVVVAWECTLRHPEDGTREGAAAFVRDYLIRVTPRAFDDFAASAVDRSALDRALGLAGACA